MLGWATPARTIAAQFRPNPLKQPRDSAQEHQPISPEVDDQRHERANMERDIERKRSR